MSSEIGGGRRIVLGVIVATLALSAVAIVAFNVLVGSERLHSQLFRFALTVLLSIFLYRRARWARWVAIALFAIAGVGALLGGVVLLRSSAAGLLLLATGAIYLASSGLLLFAPSVGSYFAGEAPA